MQIFLVFTAIFQLSNKNQRYQFHIEEVLTSLSWQTTSAYSCDVMNSHLITSSNESLTLVIKNENKFPQIFQSDGDNNATFICVTANRTSNIFNTFSRIDISSSAQCIYLSVNYSRSPYAAESRNKNSIGSSFVCAARYRSTLTSCLEVSNSEFIGVSRSIPADNLGP